jgi:hypothetical protein
MWTVTDAVLVVREGAVLCCLSWGFVASGWLRDCCLTEQWSTQSHLHVVVAVLRAPGQLLTAISTYLNMIQSL